MRKKFIAGLAGVVALIGAGVLAGASLAGEDAAQEVGETIVAKPIVAAQPSSKAAAAAKGRGPTIQFFFARQSIAPAPGDSLVQGLRCPRGAGNPIGGGLRSSDGLAVSYLSRANPQTGKLPRNVYYVGAENVSAGAAAPAIAEIQCARGLRVVAR